MNEPTQFVQYALLTPDGKYATMMHQDDEETPLIAKSLTDLLYICEEWADHIYVSSFLDDLEDPKNDHYGYKIHREVVTRDVEPIPMAELRAIAAEDE